MTTKHDSQAQVDSEFKTVYDQAQPKQFRNVTSTPILADMQDGEVVTFSSGVVKIMFRVGQEIFAVGVSCVTVRR